MGLGDDVMFLGEASHLHKQIGKKITPVYGKGWSPLFENIDFLSESGGVTLNARDTNQKSDYHVNYYVQSKSNTLVGTRLNFMPYSPKRFAIPLTQEEEEYADETLKGISKFAVVNPDYKSSFFSNNKNWGFKKYQRVVDELAKDITIVRVNPGGEYKEPGLKNAINIYCPDIRKQIALWKRAKFGLTFDGLMVHVLSGYKIPVVNIMGGLLTSYIISYPGNINLEYRHPASPCGATFDCPHCKDANQAITVEQVYQACQKLL